MNKKQPPQKGCSLSAELCQKSRDYLYNKKRFNFLNRFHRGAGNRTRTDDLVLTKDALYLLSYTSVFSQRSYIISNQTRFVKAFCENYCLSESEPPLCRPFPKVFEESARETFFKKFLSHKSFS